MEYDYLSFRGIFLKMPLKKQNPPLSSLSMHCACMSGGKLCLFFSKPAAPCMFCFGRRAVSRLSNFNGTYNQSILFFSRSWRLTSTMCVPVSWKAAAVYTTMAPRPTSTRMTSPASCPTRSHWVTSEFDGLFIVARFPR